MTDSSDNSTPSNVTALPTAAANMVIQPAPTPAPEPQVIQVVTQAAPVVQPLSFTQKLSSGVEYLWKNDKVFLIIFGLLIVAGKMTSVIMDMLASSSRKDVAQTQSQDSELKAKEDSYNNQAATLEQKAQTEGQGDAPVTEDWYEKK